MNVFLPSTAFSCLEKKMFQNILLQAEMWIVLCYLIASHSNSTAFNLQIPSFIVAFLRVRRMVVHYSSMQFRHLLYKQKRNQEGWGLKTLSQVT